MAEIFGIKLPNGSSYDIVDSVARSYNTDSLPSLVEKTYTGVIGTANNWANATFFFGKIVPTDYNYIWRIHYKIEVISAGVTYSKNYADVTITGAQSSILSYASFNTIENTSYRAAYYHVVYRATSAGVTNDYGHLLGLRLYSSWNPTTSANARTVNIKILQTDNCEFTFFDSVTKYSAAPGTGSTNYNGYSEIDFANNGLSETGDSNTVDNVITYFGNKTGSKGIWATSLVLEDENGTYQNICTASDGTVTTTNRTNATTKIANTNGFKVGRTILYANASYNANTNISGWGVIYTSFGLFDSRYCMNTSLTAGSLTTYAPIYLVGTVSEDDGLYYLDSTWWTQTPTTTGKVYVLIGGVYDSTTSNCRISLYEENPWYYYDGSKLQRYIGDAQTVNGHTVNIDVPSNAKFTDTTYSSKTAASGGTDLSLVTTGEKYTWNSKTSNTGTITGVSVNGTSVATSGVANITSIPNGIVTGLGAAALKGVTDNSSSTAVTSTDTNLITGRTLYYAGYTKNTGTVTSVRVQATSPITSSTNTAQTSTLNTTIALADGYGDTKNPYTSKTKNYVLAAPSGAAGTPSFRALVAADIPSLDASKITSGTLSVARGGTGSSTLTGAGIVTLTDDQEITGSKFFYGSTGFRNTADDPGVWFSSNEHVLLDGRIYLGMRIVNDAYITDRFYFREYSYSSTGDARLDTFEQYRLPTVDLDRTTQVNYEILTDKTPVTVAQGGTGVSSFTANRVIMSGSTTTGALTTKAITDNSSSTAVSSTDTNLITGRTLYYAGYTKNTGTVTSVRVQATSPITSSTNTAQTSTLNTTIALADGYGDTKNPYASKTKNYVLAAPSTAAGVPSFRALVATDIPSLDASKITSGTLPVSRGGTGMSALSTGSWTPTINWGDGTSPTVTGVEGYYYKMGLEIQYLIKFNISTLNAPSTNTYLEISTPHSLVGSNGLPMGRMEYAGTQPSRIYATHTEDNNSFIRVYYSNSKATISNRLATGAYSLAVNCWEYV